MGKLAEAYVDIVPSTGDLDRGLDDTHHKLKSFVGSATKNLVGLGAGLGAGVLAAGLLESAKAAADLGETVSKTRVVFGDGFGAVSETAEVLVEKFGLVKKEILDAASNIGLITEAAGMSKRESADLSSTFVKLAADASSFYNVPLDEALEKIRSALVGESEPIRSFGVLLSEAAIKAEALRLGLVKTTKELTEQTKVMARASLIIRGMSAAAGDLERTQDSASNQLRKLSGDWENFKTTFGESLTGPLIDAIKLARDLGGILNNVTGGKQGETIGDTIGAGLRAARGAAETKNPFQWWMEQFIGLFPGFHGDVARQKNQEEQDRIAGVKKHQPGIDPVAPTPAQANEARRQEWLMKRFNEARAEAQERAKRAELEAMTEGLDVDPGFQLIQELIDMGPQKKRRSTAESAGVTSLEEAKRLTQTAVISKDPNLEEAKKANAELKKANQTLDRILGEAGKPVWAAAVARGRQD